MVSGNNVDEPMGWAAKNPLYAWRPDPNKMYLSKASVPHSLTSAPNCYVQP